ncbi:group III truncated hemoglobin [Marinibaculum pumilum]|uniref:Group III truncated hemoglobin n=1 Tax=Marinibaculum pumilum TaxID=1766165 RepID=A0ABV7L8C1_9PROT
MSELKVRGDPEGGPERRAQLSARVAAETGIDEAMIDRLVRHFYGKVRGDPLLGPVFAARIADWEPHLRRMVDFWSSVALYTGRYHGQPMPVHQALPVDAVHFDRWLHLFEAAAGEVCPPAAAAHFLERARRIAASLELGRAMADGVMLRPGERYRLPEPGGA